jgi:hypothetical protein
MADTTTSVPVNALRFRQCRSVNAASPIAKMPDLSLLDVVNSALKRKRVQRTFDIAFNAAAGVLRSAGEAALPAIESVLIENSSACHDVNSLPGLSDVLVVYFDLAKEHGIERASVLLKSLQGNFQKEALTAVWSIWIGRSTRDLIPSQLIDEIKMIATRGNIESRNKAVALLQSYSNSLPR